MKLKYSNLQYVQFKKFCVGSRVWQTPEEGRWKYLPERCGNNNKDEDNNPKTLNYKKKMKWTKGRVSLEQN